MNSEPVLDIRNLGLYFGSRRVLDNISFRLFPEEIVSIIGPNGAGKTSLVRALSRQLEPAAGTIHFMGRDIRNLDNGSLARQMAVVRQTLDPLPMTVESYVLLGRLPFFKPLQFFDTRQDRDLACKYMEMTGIAHLAGSSMDQISGGEYQLAALARALTQEPSLLVLDEPTAHLDITHASRILELISELRLSLNLTVLMVIHDLNLASEYSDRLVLVHKDRGELYAVGTPETIITRENIQDVYHTRVEIARNPVSDRPCLFLSRENPFRPGGG